MVWRWFMTILGTITVNERETLMCMLGILQSRDHALVFDTMQDMIKRIQDALYSDNAVTSIPFANISTNVTC